LPSVCVVYPFISCSNKTTNQPISVVWWWHISHWYNFVRVIRRLCVWHHSRKGTLVSISRIWGLRNNSFSSCAHGCCLCWEYFGGFTISLTLYIFFNFFLVIFFAILSSLIGRSIIFLRGNRFRINGLIQFVQYCIIFDYFGLLA
jgi:hypothetical protein